jgi:hypothetical protein
MGAWGFFCSIEARSASRTITGEIFEVPGQR